MRPHRRAAPPIAPTPAHPYTAPTTTAQTGGPQRAAPMLVLRLIVLLLLALTVAASTLSRHVLIVWRDSDGHNAIAGHSAALSIIPAAGAVEVDHGVFAPPGLTVWPHAPYVHQAWPVCSGSGNSRWQQWVIPYAAVVLALLAAYLSVWLLRARGRHRTSSHCWRCGEQGQVAGMRCRQCGARAARGAAIVSCAACESTTTVALAGEELLATGGPRLSRAIQCRHCHLSLAPTPQHTEYVIEFGDRLTRVRVASFALALVACLVVTGAPLVGGIVAAVGLGLALSAKPPARARVATELSAAVLLGVCIGYGVLVPAIPPGTVLW